MKKILITLSAFILTSAIFIAFFSKQQKITISNPPVITENKSNDSVKNLPEPGAKQNQTIYKKIPILMYHYIRDYNDKKDPIGINLSVSPQTFEKQLQYLKENNFQSVGLDFLQNQSQLNKKPIIITFDDGYQDAYDSAFPLLQKYSFIGNFYLIVNKINTPGYLTWDEILQMKQAGMQFGSHTLTHPDLTKISTTQLNNEINQSKKILEEKIGSPIYAFCYPSGKFDSNVENAIKNAGYLNATTTKSGLSNLENPFELQRFRITEKSNLQSIL